MKKVTTIQDFIRRFLQTGIWFIPVPGGMRYWFRNSYKSRVDFIIAWFQV